MKSAENFAPMRKGLFLLLIIAVQLPMLAAAAEEKAVHFLKKPDSWFASEVGRTTADIILSYQAAEGGWPKNTNTVSKKFEGERRTLKGTFDNSATTDELRFLARSFNATKEQIYKEAFLRGLKHILEAQYSNGGWPQYFPLPPTYNRRITFNDGSMARLMTFLKEVHSESRYDFLETSLRQDCETAFQKGVACILKCQIVMDGTPTVWCQQHHEETLLPAGARTYELASFSGAESVGLVRLLMKITPVTPEIKTAVESAVVWLDAHKICGIRLESLPDEKSPTGTNLTVVKDPSAGPVWARFYDLKSGKPYFCDRDGVPKDSIDQIGYERRNGYGWYGDWPKALIEQEYPDWQSKLNTR